MRRIAFWTGKKAYRPNGRSQLGYDSGDSRSPDTHTHGKNEKRIQNDIQHSADKSRDHTHPGKALGVNVTVHAQADGYKGTSQQINGKVAVGKGKGCITGSEGIQKGLFKQQPRDSEQDTGAQQHGKSIADHFFRPLDIAFSPCDGTERRTADPEQIGKGDDCGNNRHGKTQACKGKGGMIRNAADIHSVHDIIKDIDQLSQCHRQRQRKNIFYHTSFGKIIYRIFLYHKSAPFVF